MHKMKHLPSLFLLALIAVFSFSNASAVNTDDLLRPAQAFQLSADGTQPGKILVKWRIAEGYYLYENKFKFSTNSTSISFSEPNYPKSEIKQDDFFGEIGVYRDEVIIEIPFTINTKIPEIINLKVKSQGCADIGVCFPPHSQTLLVAMSQTSDEPSEIAPDKIKDIIASGSNTSPIEEVESIVEPTKDPLAALTDFGDTFGLDEEDDILPPEVAYQLSQRIDDNDNLILNWKIANGTYLYFDKVKVSVEGGKGLSLGSFDFPEPEKKPDSVRPDGSIGDVLLYHDQLALTIPLNNTANSASTSQLTVKYQGCADRGICYPPITKKFTLTLPEAGTGLVTLDNETPQSNSNNSNSDNASTTAAAVVSLDTNTDDVSDEGAIANLIKNSSTLAMIGIFFIIGLGLAFTPCVFPMIPILSGIITGQGKDITTRRAAYLSTVYVLAMALTYTSVGVLAAMSGENLQILLQIPWVIATFSGIFVLLALSMFGFYEIQLPSSLQSKITSLSNSQSGGGTIGVAIMGLLSALIVGPCVAPPLAGALLYISQTNDPVLGGLALFAMSMGMGLPLIVIGASAGKLLPRAGAWMDTVKAAFGVSMLGLAIYFLERILPESAIMALWSILFISTAIYMGALQQLAIEATGWTKLWKGIGVVFLIYGALLLVGVAADSKDLRQPLRGVSFSGGSAGTANPDARHFKRITTMTQLDAELTKAKANGQPAVLDFYADWCVYCKTLEKEIFPAPPVQAILANAVLIQADVTDAGSDDAKALMKRFGVIAPPVIIFWDNQGNELKRHKIVGDVTLAEFIEKAGNAIR